MSETETLFAALRQSSTKPLWTCSSAWCGMPGSCLEQDERARSRRHGGIDEEAGHRSLLNAVGLGMFEMTWNVMCPSCAGVLSANKSLKTLIGRSIIARSAPRL